MNKALETARKMKDSGVEWVGEIPQEWELPLLGSHFKERSEKVNDKDFPPLSVTKKGVVPQLENVAKTDNNDNRKKICINDFVINSRSDRKGSSGLSKYEGSTSNISIVLKLKDIFPMYAHYLLKSQGFTEEFYRWGSGIVADLWSTRYSSMKKINIPLPPFHEQQAIANYLDEQVEKIDTLIVEQKVAMEKWKEYKQSLITETVTKGLNPDVEMKDSGIEWIGKIPKNWGLIPNKYVMKKVKDICVKYNNEDILSLTMNGVVVRDLDNPVGKMPSTFDGYQRLNKGNLLMCLFDIDVTPRCIGLIKNDGLTSPAYSQFTLKNKNIANYYYYYYLNLDFTKELLHLSKNLRNSLTENLLGAVKVPLPPIHEQQAIANYLDEKVRKIDQTIEQKQELIKQLEEYKQSLIYECVTGKRWVR